jgi:hypothetical protein
VTLTIFVLLTYGLVAIVVGYCLVRGLVDLRSGRPRFGIAGIVIGLAVLVTSAIPVRTHVVTLDLPHP